MDLPAQSAAKAPTMPTPLDLASLLNPPTDYWLLGLVFGGCLATTLATRILACRLAQRDLPAQQHAKSDTPSLDVAATHRLLRWQETLVMFMVGALVTYLFGAGIIMVRAGEAALFTTAVIITVALTPLLVIAMEALHLPAAERSAERAGRLAGHAPSVSENTTLRRAA